MKLKVLMDYDGSRWSSGMIPASLGRARWSFDRLKILVFLCMLRACIRMRGVRYSIDSFISWSHALDFLKRIIPPDFREMKF